MRLLPLLLLLAACGGSLTMPEPTPARQDAAASTMQTRRLVTGWTIWADRYQVPARYRHAVDWHGWSGGHVLAVFSYEYVCAFINDIGAPHVRTGELLDCTWYAPRGT